MLRLAVAGEAVPRETSCVTSIVLAAIELLILDIDHVCLIIITHGNLHHRHRLHAAEARPSFYL